MVDDAGTAPRIVLFGRAGCHLCDAAREVVTAVAAEQGVAWAEVDVDHPGPGWEHRDLTAELGELVPVVEVDGVPRGYWRIDADRVRRGLGAASRRA
ncbi:glutaredoxin family protein [Cellulomonas massiliensis]|uniref:glutaredoxin family protein n=1 Tax=Cellulomonas massiliensis TaxID=1465811 RepID=UPI0002D4F248|nr:glutaredoxin family protein [Cellulomonas massiliensis]